MKTIFAFICILSCSVITFYALGCYFTNSPNLALWTESQINFFISFSIVVTLFGFLGYLDYLAVHIVRKNMGKVPKSLPSVTLEIQEVI